MKKHFVIGTAGVGICLLALIGGSVQADEAPAQDTKDSILADLQAWDDTLLATNNDPNALQAIVDAKSLAATQHLVDVGALLEAPTPVDPGIHESVEAPAPTSVFRGQNRWGGTVAGVDMVVFAGEAGEDSSVGRLLVSVGLGPAQTLTTIDLPDSGALRVDSVQGAVLSLARLDGSLVSFDLATLSWV